MKLIDAGKLLDVVQGAIDVMDAHGMDTVGATSLKAIIKCVPAVDAIPVEWLREQMDKCDDNDDIEGAAAISWLIRTWHEGQEAQDGKA